MFEWIQSLVGRAKREKNNLDPLFDLHLFEKAGGSTVDIIAAIVNAQCELANTSPSTLVAAQAAFLLGYIQGCSDVIGQSFGAKRGSGFSMNVSMKVYGRIFGDSKQSRLCDIAMELAAMSNPEFEQGMSCGGNDGNGLGVKEDATGLARYLGASPHILDHLQSLHRT